MACTRAALDICQRDVTPEKKQYKSLDQYLTTVHVQSMYQKNPALGYKDMDLKKKKLEPKLEQKHPIRKIPINADMKHCIKPLRCNNSTIM